MRPRNPTEDEYKQMLANMGKVGAGRSLPVNSKRVASYGVSAAPPPHLPRELVIVGQIKSGKNRILITRTGHRYPPKEFKAWRDEVVGNLVKQWKQPAVTDPVRLHITYWPGDRRTRDVSGMADALFHVLVKAGVLKDDGLVWDLLWYRQPMNRKGPKVLITVQEWGA